MRDYGLPPTVWPDGWEGCLGLEPTPDMFVGHLVSVFREARRVLRDDGTLWLNIGDSYAGGGGGNYGPAKPKDLLMIPALLALALRADGWWLRSDIIWSKCLSGGARLYAKTQKGEQPQALKDLARLDPSTVQLWNGEKWTQVLAWTPAERDVQLEVELRNGERIGCTPEHRWPTARGVIRSDELVTGDVIDATTLPEPDHPRQFMGDTDLGYLIGLYLAEGSRSGATVQIACHADHVDAVRDQITPVVERMHGSAVAHRTGGKAATVNLNGPITAAAIDAYVSGGNAKTKHLTARAWARSDKFLRAVMHGYLDGDAHWRSDAHQWVLGFTANDALAADLRTMAARLGYSLRLRRCVHRNQHGEFPGWRGSLVMEPERRRRPDTEVAAIRKSRGRKFWDVTVADEPHTFALASGTMTHNSNPMPESVTDRPTSAHEHIFLLAKSASYFYDAAAISEPAAYVGPNGAQRSPYGQGFTRRSDKQAAAAAAARSAGAASGRTMDGFNARWNASQENGTAPPSRNKRNVWEIATHPYPDAHFATFPPKLVEPCILAGSSPKACGECGAPWQRIVDSRIKHAQRVHNGKYDPSSGFGKSGWLPGRKHVETLGWKPSCDHCDDTGHAVILEPFAGTGTTGLVALRHGRSFIGIELSMVYAEMARQRIRDDAPLLNVPAEACGRV